jgi:ankyrin repeat protein
MNYIKKIKLILFLLLFTFTLAWGDEIHDVAHQGDLTKMKTLLTANPQLINAKDARNSTPLHFAADNGSIEVIELLLENGADLKAIDVDGDTPLHWAAFAGHQDVVELFIAAGAEINTKNKKGLTPLEYAVRLGHTDVVDFLLAKGVEIPLTGDKSRTLLHQAAANGQNGLVTLMISKGVTILSRSNDGGTLLHNAAIGGLSGIIDLLIEQGVDIDAYDQYGLTALHLAARDDRKAIVEMLIAKGATIDIKTNDDKTAFYLASEKGHKEVSGILLANGADVNQKPVPSTGEYFGQELPGLTPVLFAPGIISTREFNERDVTFSPDISEFYFTQWARTPRRKMTIMVATQENDKWTEPTTAPFSGKYADAEAFIDHTGKRIFFISRRPQPGDSTAGSWEIWYANRTGTDWNEPQTLASIFKGCFYPTLTSEGTLYFTSATNDLYSSRFVEGKYLQPESLGNSVNTPADEYNMYVAPDERFIIFTSSGRQEDFGGGDLYISFRDEKGGWTDVKNMGASINSSFHEYCPSFSPDGKYFFFTSDKAGTEDIYWVDAKIIEQLKK